MDCESAVNATYTGLPVSLQGPGLPQQAGRTRITRPRLSALRPARRPGHHQISRKITVTAAVIRVTISAAGRVQLGEPPGRRRPAQRTSSSSRPGSEPAVDARGA